MARTRGRYAKVETLTGVAADGNEIVYYERRFLPQAKRMQVQSLVTVRQGERIDLIAARSLGQSQAWWRIGDANDAVDPWQLTARPGRVLRIPSPKNQIQGDS